ncbi:MAG: histidine triad nucleotide-binding protein [Candidatus Sungbacteria bacterium]|uniref:Histidine triad nucleotide-binding protein n=1 Tax=Candidatus Sungiibacteriota bacterium TaxID=2750080 RepID=A0A9D6QS70_9BACT|nr:histidine triad nucleotide-binding protein [Candidatus Sungbacteria bacterium]
MTDCIFCKISKSELPSDTVFADNEVLAFRDIHPKAPVHVLIIPKKHIDSIHHIESAEASLISKLVYTAKDIATSERLKGYKLLFNVGREGGQVVDHLHLHLLGGWEGGSPDAVAPFKE